MTEQNTEQGRRPLWGFIPVEWRGTTAVVEDSGRLGISFDGAGGLTFRYSLGVENARDLSESISEVPATYEDKHSHSDKSSGIPSEEGSKPADG